MRQGGWRQAFSRLFWEGDLFLAVGAQMADRLCSFGCPRAKIRVQHVGIDLERIALRAREWPGAGCEVVLLYCGRLVEKKGVLYALLAFARGLLERTGRKAGIPVGKGKTEGEKGEP